jgi:hypothetical protein
MVDKRRKQRMVGYPDRKVVKTRKSFCDGDFIHSVHWCSGVEGMYKKKRRHPIYQWQWYN